MGLSEALRAYNDYTSLCPACQHAAKVAGKRILSNCKAGKHARTKGVPVGGPPA